MSGLLEGSPSAGADAEESLPAGTQLGRFRVERVLGRGGMATVYLTEMQGAGGFSRPIALKLIHPHLAHNRTFRTGFINEARLGGTLLHPNLVSTLDFGEEEGRMFMALEYVEGCTVSELSRSLQLLRRPMPLSILISILIQVCKALDYAHRARDREGRPLNLIHRDIKPSNIMVDRFGGVKLGDFGVARAAMNLEQTEVTGIVKGSLRYMSPEQAMGLRTIDARSDLFSLSIVAYELFTQARLYDAPNDLQGLRMAQDAQVEQPLRRLYDLQDGDELLPIFRRGLARLPEERFSTAAELRLALEAVLYRCGSSPMLDDHWLEPFLSSSAEIECHTLQSSISPITGYGDLSAEEGMGRTIEDIISDETDATKVQKHPSIQDHSESQGSENDSSAHIAWAVSVEPDMTPPHAGPEGLSPKALHLLSRPEIDLTGLHTAQDAAQDVEPHQSTNPFPFNLEKDWSPEVVAKLHPNESSLSTQLEDSDAIQWPPRPDAESPFERVTQLRALLLTNPEATIPLLREMATDDQDRNVREFCRQELKRLAPDSGTQSTLSPRQDAIQRAIQLIYLLYAFLFLALGLYLLVLQPSGISNTNLYLLRFARERPSLNLMVSGLCFWAMFESPSRTPEGMVAKVLALIPILFSYPLGPILGPGLLCGLYLQYRGEPRTFNR